MTEHRHETHPEIVKRLKRAEGHLKSVIAMIEGGRPCLDIAQQLHAVEKAIGAVGREQRQTVEEFKTIAKYL